MAGASGVSDAPDREPPPLIADRAVLEQREVSRAKPIPPEAPPVTQLRIVASAAQEEISPSPSIVPKAFIYSCLGIVVAIVAIIYIANEADNAKYNKNMNELRDILLDRERECINLRFNSVRPAWDQGHLLESRCRSDAIAAGRPSLF